MPGLFARLLLLLLGAARGSRGAQQDQCSQSPANEAGALNLGQRWGDPSPTATMTIDLRKVTSATSTFEFRTFDPEGVIFYGDTNPRTDWFVLGLRQGKPEIQIHNTVTNISVSGGQRINDGQWHEVMVKNEGDSVVLGLDGDDLLTLRQVSYAIIDNPSAEVRIAVGGVLIPGNDLLVPINTAMDGCLRQWNWLNTSSTWHEGATLEGEGIKACFANIQRGSFFPGHGLASFLLSGLPTGLSLADESGSLAVEMQLSAGRQVGTVLAISPLEQGPVLSLRLQDTDVVAQLGDKAVVQTPLPMTGCQGVDVLLRVTSAQLTLRLNGHETSEAIQKTDFEALRHVWLSKDGRLFIGGFPGQGESPQPQEEGFFRGCLREIRVQGHQLDLDMAHYRSHTIWAHSCPGKENINPASNSSSDNSN
ncbi:sex hormone-binding globulin [Eublepharis macularius]|uniref:Sex hormone-binding globulin n=1 Tax=Eublepharis macularius TaxID=481883 RepID=A0AA97K9W4_EUBMA|nr:sex hormone-binding globulin [Eublepharis macularius]